MTMFDSSTPYYLANAHQQRINLICEAFYQNPRLRSMVNQSSENKIRDGIRNIISYAYQRANRAGGVFTSTNKDAVLLYYKNSALQLSTADMAVKIKLILFTLPASSVWKALTSEKKIKSIRNAAAQAFGDDDYLYVWFLAQSNNTKGLSSLVELKEHIFSQSQTLGLPIYMETTVERMVPVYKRMGFHVYRKLQLSKKAQPVWLFRFCPTQTTQP